MTKEEMLELQSIIEAVVSSNLEPIKNEISDVKNEISDVKNEISDVKQEISDVKQEISDVKQKVDTMDTRLRQLEIKVEHKIDNALKVTMDGHKDLTRKIDAAINLESRVVSLENDMSAVKYHIKKQQA